jgi:ubiquinone/menaquinone biosynthesis C-methylase UbiE
MEELYTLENARKYNWASISGDLHPVRVSHLDRYLVGDSVLDAGCGGGAYVEFLANKGLNATGCDKHDQFLTIARERGRLGTYVQSDITDLQFPDGSFDTTYCFDVLEHVDEELAVRELARVTRKRLIIAVPRQVELFEKYNLTFLHYQDNTHLRYYTEASLRALIRNVPHAETRIFPEIPIPVREMTQDLVRFDIVGSGIRKIARRFYAPLFRQLLQRANCAVVHTGLVAVVDF